MSSKVNEYGFLINIRVAKPPSSFLRVFYCLRRFFIFHWVCLSSTTDFDLVFNNFGTCNAFGVVLWVVSDLFGVCFAL